ncbi:hypothetical protein B0H17DRAFT_550997 [Mycena rosella]|uniref:Uncharacterized protein n=1 Tax=Mycena rosella TaxID=1033263 RepID=A0AAD7DI33_MYCRO|nr:hypothetical protein B0H17DRAFT_550997 [Mycena rosella]
MSHTCSYGFDPAHAVLSFLRRTSRLSGSFILPSSPIARFPPHCHFPCLYTCLPRPHALILLFVIPPHPRRVLALLLMWRFRGHLPFPINQAVYTQDVANTIRYTFLRPSHPV